MSTRDRRLAVATARRATKMDAIVFDTETTGIGQDAEIVDISCVDLDGTVLLNTLVCPTRPIPPEATQVHGICNADVEGSPTFDGLIGYVDELFRERLVVAYNLDFDLRMINQSLRHRGVSTRPYQPMGNIAYATHWGPGLCAMLTFAQWHGEWNYSKKGYRWHKLNLAARRLAVPFPEPQHRAQSDALATAGVVKALAQG